MLRWAGIMLVVGVLVGMLVHVLDSAPEALAFTATAARVALGLVVVLGCIFGSARLVLLGEAPLLAGVAALLVGAVAAYPFGPTWIPAATVSGTYTLSLPGMPVANGLLTCEWLPGRWRVGSFAATTPIVAPNGDELLLNASRADLKAPLQALGMPLAFDQVAADFTGIHVPQGDADRLFVSEVVHQANIDVDERGTEAAAATAVIGGTGGGPGAARETTLRLDHPFLFFVRDLATGAVLFMGQVTDPSA